MHVVFFPYILGQGYATTIVSWERERERERERQTDRERQTERETERERGERTDGQTDRGVYSLSDYNHDCFSD